MTPTKKQTKNGKILIIGINGGLAQLTAKFLLQENPGMEIIGVDSRNIRDSINDERVKLRTIRYTRNDFESLFRGHSFDSVYHLGRITIGKNTPGMLQKRLEMNLIGTQHILDLAARYAVRRTIILSTFHVYGALSDNPIFITENTPLRASLAYPELRDVVEMDQICTNWMWQHQNTCETLVFRPCNIVGPNISNAITQYLKNPLAINPMDYNPMMQFLHEYDMAKLLILGQRDLPPGIYNAAPKDFLPLQNIIETIHDKHTIHAPVTLLGILNLALNKFGLGLPSYLLEYLKFSCLISNDHLIEHLPAKFQFKYNTNQAIDSLRTYA